MRHRVVKKKLATDREHMRSMLNNLSTELIMKEKLVTTLAKAKALRPHIEKMVTYAGKAAKNTSKLKIHNTVKYLSKKVFNSDASKKLIEDISLRFASTPGGYTRIVRTGNRDGDHAEMARIEFTKGAQATKPTKTTDKKVAKKKVEKTDE